MDVPLRQEKKTVLVQSRTYNIEGIKYAVKKRRPTISGRPYLKSGQAVIGSKGAPVHSSIIPICYAGSCSEKTYHLLLE